MHSLENLTVIVLLFFGLICAGENPGKTSKSRPKSRDNLLKVDDNAPGFSLLKLTRNDQRKSFFFSRVCGERAKHPRAVLINFWATNCGPCLKEIPYLLEATKSYDGKLVRIFISEDFVSKFSSIDVLRQAVAEKAEEKGIFDHVLLDPYGVVGKKYNPEGRIPITFLVSPEGKIVGIIHFSDDISAFKEKLNSAIEKAVGEAEK